MRKTNKTGVVVSIIFAITFILVFAGAINFAQDAQGAPRPATITTAVQGGSSAMSMFQDMFEYSLKEKKGLLFFVKGQTIAGGVTKIIGNEAVEVRNQTYSRIVIRVDQIDAVAMN